ncbi:hypothetical protein FSP39_018231 [Pinctada imbricata]|uniref:QRICH1-like domain-containing protein n=1 Tax=Pinctada imbricata TaxID=66713 RepID=A0AA88Y863_PINIB|nr:hypothetical protein FSP39_018231 [Pinctada imbricata]
MDDDRFPSVAEDEIERIFASNASTDDEEDIDGASRNDGNPQGYQNSTNKVTRFFVNLFKEYLGARGLPDNFEKLEKNELDTILSKFYVEVRNKNGEKYRKSSLLGMRNSINRHLQKYSAHYDLFTDKEFKKSMTVFDAVLKDLKKDGKWEVNSYLIISDNDVKKMFDYFDVNDPIKLQHKVFVDLIVYFRQRGAKVSKLRQLRTTDFIYGTEDYTGLSYIQLVDDHNEEELPDRDEHSNKRMYAVTGDEKCPVRSFMMYKSHLDPGCPIFFQRAKEKISASEQIWYKKAPLGKNSLGSMMPQIRKPSALFDSANPDWAPTLKLGHTKDFHKYPYRVWGIQMHGTQESQSSTNNTLDIQQRSRPQKCSDENVDVARERRTKTKGYDFENDDNNLNTIMPLNPAKSDVDQLKTKHNRGDGNYGDDEMDTNMLTSKAQKHGLECSDDSDRNDGIKRPRRIIKSHDDTRMSNLKQKDISESHTSTYADKTCHTGVSKNRQTKDETGVLSHISWSKEKDHKSSAPLSDIPSVCLLCGKKSVNKSLISSDIGIHTAAYDLITKYFGCELDFDLGTSLCTRCEQILELFDEAKSQMDDLEEQLWRRMKHTAKGGLDRHQKLHPKYMYNGLRLEDLKKSGIEGYSVFWNKFDPAQVVYNGTSVAEQFLSESKDQLIKFVVFCQSKKCQRQIVQPVGVVINDQNIQQPSNSTQNSKIALPILQKGPFVKSSSQLVDQQVQKQSLQSGQCHNPSQQNILSSVSVSGGSSRANVQNSGTAQQSGTNSSQIQNTPPSPVQVQTIQPALLQTQFVQPSPVQTQYVQSAPVQTQYIQTLPVQTQYFQPVPIQIQNVPSCAVQIPNLQSGNLQIQNVQNAPVQVQSQQGIMQIPNVQSQYVQNVQTVPYQIQNVQPGVMQIQNIPSGTVQIQNVQQSTMPAQNVQPYPVKIKKVQRMEENSDMEVKTDGENHDNLKEEVEIRNTSSSEILCKVKEELPDPDEEGFQQLDLDVQVKVEDDSMFVVPLNNP